MWTVQLLDSSPPISAFRIAILSNCQICSPLFLTLLVRYTSRLGSFSRRWWTRPTTKSRLLTWPVALLCFALIASFPCCWNATRRRFRFSSPSKEGKREGEIRNKCFMLCHVMLRCFVSVCALLSQRPLWRLPCFVFEPKQTHFFQKRWRRFRVWKAKRALQGQVFHLREKERERRSDKTENTLNQIFAS